MYTVIGYFNDVSFNRVKQRLISEGFNGESIYVSYNSVATQCRNDDAGLSRFERAAQRSNTIITLLAQTADDAHQVALILDEFGALDIDEGPI